MHNLLWTVSFFVLSTFLGQAYAQTAETPPTAPPTPADAAYPRPLPPPPPPPPRYYVQTYDAHNPPRLEYGLPPPQRLGQVSFYFGLPMWLSETGDSLSTGFSFEGRLGFDMGYLVPEMGFGTQTNWFDSDSLRDQGSLSAWWLTLGARFQWLNRSFVTPFASVAFDMNFWHLSGDQSLACDPYFCEVVNNYRFAPGLSGRVGAALALHPMFAFELGLRTALTFEGSMFDHTETWLSPFFGGTFYF